jgi:HSP20 family molecular chaperone IbpA
MAIIRWNPWSMDRFFEEDWDLPTIPGLSRLVGQGLNIYEGDNDVVVEAALPGVSEDKIDVTIEDNGIARITGSYEETKEDKSKRKYYMSSMAQSYNYSFRLPKVINTEQDPVCEFNNGVLKMVFPKTEKKAPKKIKVQTKPKNIQSQQQQPQQ